MGSAVLQLHDSAGLYGAESVILALGASLAKTRYRPVIGCLREGAKSSPALGEAARRLGLATVEFPMSAKYDLSVVGKIGRIIGQRNVAILHAHGYKSNMIGVLAARRYAIPMVSTNHLFPPMPLDNRKLQFYASVDARFVMRRIDRIVAVSAEIREKLARKGVPREKLVVIENGVDIDTFASLGSFDRREYRRSLGIPPDAPVVGTLGRLTPQKGQEFLLRSAGIVRKRRPDAEFVIAGDGPLEQELKSLARELGIADRVHFLGFRGDTAKLLKAFDVFVLSSIDEGLPMAMLEAMASGTPVVVTAVGEVPRVIVDGRNGWLVEPRNVEQLAERLTMLLSDPARQAACAALARETVVRGHSQEAMGRKYCDVYETLMKGGPAPLQAPREVRG